MSHYPPEGLYPTVPPTPETLRRAAGTRDIFQAMCTKCDEYHNLIVDLGSLRGLIPREETVLGIAQGKAKEIAILSRVGKPLCFQVLGFTSEGTALLSRRSAQEEARDYLMESVPSGQILPAVVQNVASFGAFCDIGCGFTALLPIERCSISRISHCSQRFSPGQQLYVVIWEKDPQAGQITLTHRELLGTWKENAQLFRPGQTVTGIVRSVRPYGTFIELTPNLSGLAEPGQELEPGQAVSVYIRSIQPQTQKIKLSVLEKLPATPKIPLRYHRTGGYLDSWRYNDVAAPTVFDS